jgi:carbon-monoxide dehydrogenase large subunit
LGIPIDNVSVVHGDTDKAVRHGHLRVPVRCRHFRDVTLDKIEAKAKKSPRISRSRRGRHRIPGRQVHRQGTDKSVGFGVALGAYTAQICRQELEPGLKEGAFSIRPISPSGRLSSAVRSIADRESVVAWTAVDDFGTSSTR